MGPRRSPRHRAKRRPRHLAVPQGLPIVATNNVHYATPAERPLATVLGAVRARRALHDLDGWTPACGDRPPALGSRAGAPVRPLAGGGRDSRRARPGVCFRPQARRSRPPRLPRPGRPHRADLARRAGAPGRSRALRPSARLRARPGRLGATRPRARRHRGSRISPATSSSCGTSSSSAVATTSTARGGGPPPTPLCASPSASRARRGRARPAIRAVPVPRA